MFTIVHIGIKNWIENYRIQSMNQNPERKKGNNKIRKTFPRRKVVKKKTTASFHYFAVLSPVSSRSSQSCLVHISHHPSSLPHPNSPEYQDVDTSSNTKKKEITHYPLLRKYSQHRYVRHEISAVEIEKLESKR